MSSSFFKPLLRNTPKKGPEQHKRNGGNAGLIVLKDQLSIQVWLSLGALLNGILFLLIGRLALAIPALIITIRLVDTLLISLRFKANPLLRGTIPGKFSAQLPNTDGSHGPKPANQQLALLLIGVRSNHPLGFLAPGFKGMGDYMNKMQDQLNREASKYNMISSSMWVGAERSTGNEIMYAMYFKSADDIHRFAHEPLHREAWSYYYSLVSDKSTDNSHLAIWHEIIQAPAGGYESVYANSHTTLLGSGRVPVTTKSVDPVTGAQVETEEWVSTVVDASRGPLKSSRGRMARTDGADNDQYKEAAMSAASAFAAGEKQ